MKAIPKARPDGGDPVQGVSFMAKPSHLCERWYERVHTNCKTISSTSLPVSGTFSELNCLSQFNMS